MSNVPNVPKRRFPEFREAGEWETKELRKVAAIIKKKAGSDKFRLMSITAGVGLVSQLEKFGREIAGAQYKNYLVIERHDFAYNKSATKEYPEGFIAMYAGNEPGAVPNSIFTCFRVDASAVFPQYLDYLFISNLHGRWLKMFITVGARAHGSLNIDDNDLLALPVPFPQGDHSLREQQKIADCLASLDELITLEAQQLDTLKTHKKGLMQQLFPAEGETLPKLRFPEFRDAGEWEEKSLGDIARITSGGTPSRAKPDFWGGSIPWITTSLIGFNIIDHAEEFITAEGLVNSSAKLFPAQTLLMAMYGQGKTRGKVALLGMEATTNQACAAIMLNEEVDTNFAFQNLASRYDEIRKLSNEGGQENLSAGLIKEIPLTHPSIPEQQKIADCLASLDDLITAQAQQLAALKTHKKGLMQQLFPVMDGVSA
ncbi:restriction endonuclease subunit S [uncultured Thiodictyon sp.]|uniref:restriction endonuclease subunit S n=1 Tax=uncultured Thiodictyon sp. TaxID=1846217 RepID=UPI0025D1BBFC|nr:restriction endonuclease subunit S [uncultured Thiodictyon sp.]